MIGNESAGDLSMNMHVISDLLYLIYQIALPQREQQSASDLLA